jgi:Fe-S-cluster-containing hydrogenase component 2
MAKQEPAAPAAAGEADPRLTPAEEDRSPVIVRLCNGCHGRFRPQDLKRRRCRNCQIRRYDTQHRRTAKQVIASHRYCVDCGSSQDLCADHIIPTSEGGANAFANYTVRCRSCNTARRNEELVFKWPTQATRPVIREVNPVNVATVRSSDVFFEGRSRRFGRQDSSAARSVLDGSPSSRASG